MVHLDTPATRKCSLKVRLTQDSAKRPYQKRWIPAPKTLGTRVSCKTGVGLDGQGARQA